MEIKSDIIDYLGKHNNGVMVLISLTCDGIYYEGILFYTNENFVISVDEELENKIGCQIEYWDGYRELAVTTLKKIVPYNEIINRLDEVDLNRFVGSDLKEDDFNIVSETSTDEVTTASASNIK
jgi:hypothetical protein